MENESSKRITTFVLPMQVLTFGVYHIGQFKSIPCANLTLLEANSNLS